MKIKAVIFGLLPLTFSMHAMHRLRSPLSTITKRGLHSVQPASPSSLTNYTHVDRNIVKESIERIRKNANIMSNDRWYEKVPHIENSVLIHNFVILNPGKLAVAVDTVNEVLHHLAPDTAKHQHMLTNYASQPYRKLPNIEVSAHDMLLYLTTLRQNLFVKKSQAYPYKAPGVTPAQLKALVDVASSKVCMVNCPKCELGKRRVMEAFYAYQTIKELTPGTPIPPSCAFGLII